MKNKRRTLGWIGFVSAIIWLYFDYAGQIKRAIYFGWVTIAATLAHIFV